MRTILSKIFGWTLVRTGVFLIVAIIRLWEWWKRRRNDTYTLPEIQESDTTNPEMPQRKISEPQTPYFSDVELHSSDVELHSGRGKRRKSKPRTPYFSTSPPPIPKSVPYPFDYQAKWWKKLSRWYRNQKDWRCEECQISLSNDPYYLHTHHIRGTRYNKLKGLKALCVGCHAEQPGQHHRGLKDTEDYKNFMKKYGRQR